MNEIFVFLVIVIGYAFFYLNVFSEFKIEELNGYPKIALKISLVIVVVFSSGLIIYLIIQTTKLLMKLI